MTVKGGEYEILRRTPGSVLGRFSHIMLEYHYGPVPLLKILENSGYHVEWTPPRPEIKGMSVGMIWAEMK